MPKERIKTVGWIGCGDPTSGYGSSDVAMRLAFERAKLPIDFVATPGHKVFIGYGPMTMHHLEAMPADSYKILYTMFEADRWPVDWVNSCNAANEIWVPSTFCKESLIASGCEAPITVIPLGFDPEWYNASERPLPGDRPFTIGYTGAGTHRKGIDLLVRAFVKEFADDEAVRLHIRSPRVASGIVPEDPRIEVEISETPVFSMRCFYQNIDLLVLPSRGEGFGLTPLEALACGTPAAFTNWGGLREYADMPGVLRIAVDGLESCGDYHGCKGKWARPSLDSIRYVMRWAFENQDELLTMGQAASTAALKRWTYDATAAAIKTRLRAIDPMQRVQTKEVAVVCWHGSPAKVTTAAGGFIRGQARELTAGMLAKLNPSDVHEGGFAVEKRLRRV